MIWVVAGIMMLVVLLALLLPLWRGRGALRLLDSDTANIAVLKEQLAELDLELANGNMTREQHAQACRDLQRAAAADLSDAGADGGAVAAEPLSRPARRWFSLILVVLLPLSSVLFYQQVSSYREVAQPPAAATATGGDGQQEKTPPLTELVEVLAARLRAEPDNQEGWKMLGKTYMLLQRVPEAVAAFEQSYQRGGSSDVDLLADLAEALAYANGNLMQGRPHAILKQALQIQPDLPKALWLSGFAWFQQEDYARAVKDWEGVLNSPDLDTQARQVLVQYLAEARKQAGLPARADETGQQDKTAVQIAVHVSLDASLRDQAKPEDVVFVFAKLAEGMPMPLAVRKIAAKDLPATVVLDDSMSMLQGHSLAGKSKVIVGARVSKSGAPVPQAGDLQGLSAVIDPKTTPEISIRMDQVVQ